MEETTRGISSVPGGMKRDNSPQMRSFPPQTQKAVQEEEVKPDSSEPEENISFPQYLKTIDERFKRSGDRASDPKNSEYPTFKGGPDEYRAEFIYVIDTLQSSYNLPDSEMTSRLPRILLGVARVWYRLKCRTQKGASWEDWKALMKK